MSGEKVRSWVETLWPILGGLALVFLAYGRMEGRLTVVEERAGRAETKADVAIAGQVDIRLSLQRLETVLEERLPPKPR